MVVPTVPCGAPRARRVVRRRARASTPPRVLLPAALLASLATAHAQAVVALPGRFVDLPGNASVAMPLRWSAGTMQTIVAHDAIPAALRGATVTRVRLRRPIADGLGAQPARTVTLTLTLGRSAVRTPQNALPDTAVNWNNALVQTVVAGPVQVTVPATPAPGRDDVLGPELLDLALAQPFVMPADGSGESLIIEWRAEDPQPFSAPDSHWVDAVWIPGPARGHAVALGRYGCGTLSEPTRLSAVGEGAALTSGGAIDLRLQGVRPGQPAWMLLGPLPRPTPTAQPFPLRAECPFWLMPFTAVPTTTATPFSIPLPAALPPLTGVELTAQALVADATDGLLLSNGLALLFEDAGVDVTAFATLFLPGDGSQPAGSTFSPWGVFRGLTPILVFETS